jgi:hypothetical protein
MWSSALIRVSSLEKAGWLDSLYQRTAGNNIKSIYRRGESDLYIFARLASLGNAYVINKRLCYYRDHQDSNTKNPTLRSTHIEDNVRTYDYIYGDIDFFPVEVRAAAKINSTGRLLTGESIAVTCARILYSGMLSKEFMHSRLETVKRLKQSMERFIIDSREHKYQKIFSPEEISLMEKLINAEK